MASQRNLNDLLKWSIEHTTQNEDAPARDPNAPPPRQLDPAIIDALLGGPSDADLMKAAMEIITSPDTSISHENRMIAFDNFEQLIESLDNANNMSKLSLWTPLVELLDHEHEDFRRYAAWCVGTAVQNNAPSQERFLAAGGVPKLVALAEGDRDGEDSAVRKKAVYALSSAVRNYQPALDVAVEDLRKRKHLDGDHKIDATDMDAIDQIMESLRERVKAESS
jgi:hypothetical protein